MVCHRDQNKLPDHRLEFIKWTWIVALAVAFIAGSNLKSYSNILTDQLVEVKVKLAKDPGNDNLIRRQAQLEIQLGYNDLCELHAGVRVWVRVS